MSDTVISSVYTTDFTVAPITNGYVDINIKTVETQNYLENNQTIRIECRAPKLWSEVDDTLFNTYSTDVSSIISPGDYLILDNISYGLDDTYEYLDITGIENTTKFVGNVTRVTSFKQGMLNNIIHFIEIEVFYRDSYPILFKSKEKGTHPDNILEELKTLFSGYELAGTYNANQNPSDYMDTTFYTKQYPPSNNKRIRDKDNKTHILDNIKNEHIAVFKGFDMDIYNVDSAGNVLLEGTYDLNNLPDYSNMYTYVTPIILFRTLAWNMGW